MTTAFQRRKVMLSVKLTDHEHAPQWSGLHSLRNVAAQGDAIGARNRLAECSPRS
jgi:hypothetical protein